MAQNIVAQFPIVSRADLLHGGRCAICHDTYGAEDAVRLPCGHEFGFVCISTWLSPEGGNKTCPLCRIQLVPEVPRDEATLAIWEELITAIELDIELTARGIVHRSRGFRDWLLYSQLLSQGANLPPWHPDSADIGQRLDSSQEELLFQE